MAVAGDCERDLLRPARRDLPPWQTVYRWFARLRDETVFERMNRMNHALVTKDRQRVAGEASPSAAILDSQSVKSTAGRC